MSVYKETDEESFETLNEQYFSEEIEFYDELAEDGYFSSSGCDEI